MLRHVYGLAFSGALIKPLEFIPTLDLIILPIVTNRSTGSRQMQIIGGVYPFVEGENRSVIREFIVDDAEVVDVFYECGRASLPSTVFREVILLHQ